MEKKQKFKFHKVVLFLLLLSLSLIISCQSAPDPQLPPDPAKLNQEEKGKAYNDFKLTRKGSVFCGMHFLQGSNEQKFLSGRLMCYLMSQVSQQHPHIREA